jgi:hypothetical protein
MKFRELSIGDEFDFVNPDSFFNSFFMRCAKISPRKYVDSNGQAHMVGSINARVWNVERKKDETSN